MVQSVLHGLPGAKGVVAAFPGQIHLRLISPQSLRNIRQLSLLSNPSGISVSTAIEVSLSPECDRTGEGEFHDTEAEI